MDSAHTPGTSGGDSILHYVTAPRKRGVNRFNPTESGLKQNSNNYEGEAPKEGLSVRQTTARGDVPTLARRSASACRVCRSSHRTGKLASTNPNGLGRARSSMASQPQRKTPPSLPPPSSLPPLLLTSNIPPPPSPLLLLLLPSPQQQGFPFSPDPPRRVDPQLRSPQGMDRPDRGQRGVPRELPRQRPQDDHLRLRR